MNKIHTFAICAYKESPYLEECIKSLMDQSVRSNIIVCTATPNKYIQDIADKYKLPYYINKEQKGIGADWNFAYSSAKTQFVTIAHQDDIYFKNYGQVVMDKIRKVKSPIIIYTDYKELRGNEFIIRNKLLNIKRVMNWPLEFRCCQYNKVIRKIVLAFGNPICCPAVTFNKKVLGENPFNIEMKNSLDWEAWIRFADKDGAYVYIKDKLMAHRISELSETTQMIAKGIRAQEDFDILCRCWPKFIARILMKFYSGSMKSNNIE